MLNDKLKQFTGTDHWYRHNLVRNFNYTDGVKYVADKYGAYWLIDAIASYQSGKVKQEEFQLWELKVNDGFGLLTMRTDSDQPVMVSQEIPYTDFPESIKLYVEFGTLLLPSEH